VSDSPWLDRLKTERTIAVVRAPSFEMGRQMAAAAVAGGLSFIEIAWNSDRPAQLLGTLREAFPHCQIGAGSLRDAEQIRAAIAAGAQFLFSPHTQTQMLQVARAAGIPLVPGALTPTEILAAWERGATAVKVFPVSVVGGDRYLRSLRAPLAGVPLVPTGGVNPENAGRFLEAGAVAVGVSTGLFPEHLLAARDWGKIEALARQLRQVTGEASQG
jgi:2-dehydro-3-deoxyphosphogluconate aldolase/(4S)-4-hydroxy-2-oxoglutarate aldolase